MKTDQPITAIFGSSKPTPGSDEYQLAFDIGYALAENGITVINGGYGGTMLASAEGARFAKGTTIGVICSTFGKQNENKYITETIITHSLQERLNTLISKAQAYIVLPGGTGTLLEFAAVLELKNKKFIDQNTPLITITDFWKSIIQLMQKENPQIKKLVTFAETPQQAVAELKNRFFNTP